MTMTPALASPGQRTFTVRDSDAVAETILARRGSVPTGEALLVAVSGIDGSGKGHLTSLLTPRLNARGVSAVSINVDGWLAPPEVRFRAHDPGGNFYRNGLRLDEMFERLILPLKRQRSLAMEADLAPPESKATAYRRHRYEYREVAVIVLDGIFLLKRQYRALYDLAIWVDSSFESAMERALRRNQEGLPAAEIVREYETIYFPAERLHLALDEPRASADLIVVNDPRLEGSRV
jgi:uridine kinase